MQNSLNQNLSNMEVTTVNNKTQKIVLKDNQNPVLSIPHLNVKDLNVYIQEKHILKNINLSIPDKSITCIIGPSGCGKTTLLRSFNRLHDDSSEVKLSGSVFIDDEDIYGKGVEVTHIRKKMGLLAQRPTVLPMSIYENVAYGPRLYGARGR